MAETITTHKHLDVLPDDHAEQVRLETVDIRGEVEPSSNEIFDRSVRDINRVEVEVSQALRLEPGSPDAVAATDEALIHIADATIESGASPGEITDVVEDVAVQGALEAVDLRQSSAANPIIRLELDGHGAILTDVVAELHETHTTLPNHQEVADVVAREIDRLGEYPVMEKGSRGVEYLLSKKSEKSPEAVLSKLQPGFATQDRFMDSAKHAERNGLKGATANRERVVATHLSRLDALVQKVGIEKVMKSAIEELVIDLKNVSKGYFLQQQEVMRDNGQTFDLVGDVETKNILVNQLQDSQRTSLESWSSCLQDKNYPTWFKFYAWDGVSKMATFDTAKKEYSKRSSGTVAPYPKANAEAISKVYESIKTFQAEGGMIDDDQMWQLVKGGNFNKIYSKAMLDEKAIIPTPERFEDVKGEWIEYQPGDTEALMSASEGTPWCIAGEDAAKMYLNKKGAKFLLFHLDDDDTDRRSSTGCASIRIEDGHVAEVSGLKGGSQQYLEESLTPIVMDKVSELPGGERYIQAFKDKEKLVGMDKKTRSGEAFSVDELLLLYEVDRRIEYTISRDRVRDGRIEEFKARASDNKEILEERYGIDFEWMTMPSLEASRQIPELLQKGANPDGLFRKLKVGITQSYNNKLEKASLESAAMTLHINTNNHFEDFVRAGLSEDTIKKLFSNSEIVSSPMFKGYLAAENIDPNDLLDKVKNVSGVTILDNFQALMDKGASLDVLAEKMIDEYGNVAQRRIANPQTREVQVDRTKVAFDFSDLNSNDVTVITPIKMLAAAGYDMNKFASNMSSYQRNEYQAELQEVGVGVSEDKKRLFKRWRKNFRQ